MLKNTLKKRLSVTKCLTSLSIAMIVLPEPVTTGLGIGMLCLIYKFGKRKFKRVVYSSGVIVRGGKLPQRRLAHLI